MLSNMLVLPSSQLPSREVLEASAGEGRYSDLFPYLGPGEEDPLLGDYMMQGRMTELNPLWSIVRGVSDYRAFPEPKQPRNIMEGRFLLMNIVRCIDQAYSNLTRD